MSDIYAIVQMPDVIKTVAKASTNTTTLMQAIYDLQDNPRPNGHEPADKYGRGFAQLVIDKIVPPYHIIYRIDEEQKKVTVIAVYQTKWS